MSLFRLSITLLAGLSGTLSMTADPVTFPAEQWEQSAPEAQGLSREHVGQAIDRLQEVLGQDGVSETMLIRNGYVVWAGPNIENKHPIWSCTKSFLSTCLGLLWDDGKCTPQDLASKYLPELAEHYPAVTLEHLATFTSGVVVDKETLVVSAPDYPVGTAMHYSNQSDLLGRILTKIAGQPLEELFMSRIGTPIGITPEDLDWQDFGDLKPEGILINGGAGHPETGIHANARAVARFGWFYANGGMWDGRQLISKRYIDYATSVRVPATMPPHDPKAWYADVLEGRYGLNWWVNGVGAEGKWLWPDAPPGTFAAQGNRNNICIILPEWKMVLVRLGNDGMENIGQFNVAFAALRQSFPDQKSASE